MEEYYLNRIEEQKIELLRCEAEYRKAVRERERESFIIKVKGDCKAYKLLKGDTTDVRSNLYKSHEKILNKIKNIEKNNGLYYYFRDPYILIDYNEYRSLANKDKYKNLSEEAKEKLISLGKELQNIDRKIDLIDTKTMLNINF